MSTRKSRQQRKAPRVKVEHVLLQRPPDLIQQSFVPGRALVAWMSDEQIAAYGTAPGNDQQAIASRAAAAQAVVETRAGVEQTEALLPLPRQMNGHCEAFLASARGQALAQAGYSIALVNLSQLVAYQVHVRLPSCRERVSGFDPRDGASIARITLPIEGTNTFEVAYDPTKASWVIGADDPNLQILGPVGPEGGEGGVAVGFRVDSPVSVMSVQRYADRLFLTDGYHRAVGLLLRGVHFAPALVRDVRAFEDLRAIGHLPMAAFMGDRPPVLPDFLDDKVSMKVQVPGSRKRLLIHAMLLP